ncbi:MAG: GNAT family N-acetyltransferase, partial [Myxococcota bacterium]
MSRDERIEIVRLGAPAPEELAAMTFPVYRPLLDLAPTTRHPEQGDEIPVQPFALAARLGDRTVGLALGELPLSVVSRPELLSLFVEPGFRNRGIGRRLVEAAEREVAVAGGGELTAVYTAGRPSIPAVERILWKRAWEAPEPRTVSVRFAPADFLATELFSERRMAALGARLELFAWRDLGAAEKAAIRASDERHRWITPMLAFWRFERAGFDELSSIGARYKGEVVGWVINHALGPDAVRFTCSFLRKDISRRGRIVPLYRESLARLVEAGCQRCSLVTPVEYPNMVRFNSRWIAPFAEFGGETRGARTPLQALPPGGTPG